MGFKFRFKFNVRTSGQPESPTESAAMDSVPARFRPAAERHLRRMALFIASAIAGIGLVFLSLFLPEPWLKGVSIPGILLIALSLILFFSMPALTCPNCAKSCDGFDQFCPVCGRPQLQISRLWGTRCDACNRSLGSYKYRNYKIRYCTHCGTLLHDAGV